METNMKNMQYIQNMPNIPGGNGFNQQIMQAPFQNIPNFVNPKPNYDNSKTLYVGNLHPEIKDIDLFGVFNTYGKITHSRISKNTYTGESRCYGFVGYDKLEDAQRAQRELNNSDLMMREIRVYFKRSVKDVDQTKNFVIKNLSKDISSKQLNEEFNKFGTVVSCFVRKEDINGVMESLGYGYVQFDNNVNVENFIEQYNGLKLNDQEISVERFVPPSQRAKPQPKNLYIKQFPDNWTEEQVKNFINDEIGKVSKIESQGVFMDKRLKKFYCFVSFETIEGAKLVIDQFNDKKLEEDAEPLYVGIAESKAIRRNKIMRMRQDMRNETNLYVRSLKEEVTEEQFKAVFSVYGEVTSICLRKWVMKPNPQNENDPQANKNLKFGFVNFSKPEEASQAFNDYKSNEQLKEMVDPGNSSSFVFFFQPKRVRDSYKRMTNMNRQFMQGMHMNMPMNMNMGMMNQNFNANRGRQHMPRNMMPHMANQNFGQVQMPNMPNMPNMQTNISRTPRTERSFQNSTNQSYNNPGEQSISQQIESLMDIQEKANIIAEKKEDFVALSEDEKKNILGNIMFTRVKESYHGKEEDLPKITGMLIDLEVLDLDEILDIIKNDETLKERLEEAIEVLEDSE